ncbi:hypothetical protein Hanom_Chr06g00511401 [Helianthus anomalus]
MVFNKGVKEYNYRSAFTVCSRVKNPSPSLTSPPLPSMSFEIGKTIFRQKKPHFPSPPPVKWISGTPFSLPSPPLPLLSRSLEHSVILPEFCPKIVAVPVTARNLMKW